MISRLLALLLMAAFSSAFAQPQSNAMLDGTKTTVVPPQAPKVPLSPEMRGDIFMARKMYREAIETFREGPPKDPVLLNKIGIAYHQLMQLDNARKSYEQAVREAGLCRGHQQPGYCLVRQEEQPARHQLLSARPQDRAAGSPARPPSI